MKKVSWMKLSVLQSHLKFTMCWSRNSWFVYRLLHISGLSAIQGGPLADFLDPVLQNTAEGDNKKQLIKGLEKTGIMQVSKLIIHYYTSWEHIMYLWSNINIVHVIENRHFCYNCPINIPWNTLKLNMHDNCWLFSIHLMSFQIWKIQTRLINSVWILISVDLLVFY